MPDFRLEARCWARGLERVAGVDEAGRGPLAGPVVVAAVVLPRHWRPPLPVDDSKRMSAAAREAAFEVIRRAALAYRILAVPPQEIDRVNILQATLWGMARVVERLWPPAQVALVDGNQAPPLEVPCETVVGGDGRSLSIAAASVLAKVARDRIMMVYDRRYPQWGFAAHKGYPTPAHREALDRWGRSPIHRLSFHWTEYPCKDEPWPPPSAPPPANGERTSRRATWSSTATASGSATTAAATEK